MQKDYYFTLDTFARKEFVSQEIVEVQQPQTSK